MAVLLQQLSNKNSFNGNKDKILKEIYFMSSFFLREEASINGFVNNVECFLGMMQDVEKAAICSIYFEEIVAEAKDVIINVQSDD